MSRNGKKMLQPITWVVVVLSLIVFVGFEAIVHFTGLPDKYPDEFWSTTIVFGICLLILISIWPCFQLTSIRERWRQTPGASKSISGESIDESYRQTDKIQRVCRRIMVFGCYLAIVARSFMILLTMMDKDKWWYAASVLVVIGVLVFLSGYYISNWNANRLNTFDQNQNEILK